MTARDVDAMVACWAPGAIDSIVGDQDLVAPEGVRSYFSEIFGAFPDFTFAVQSTVTEGDRCAVLWRATGTFAGPGTFQGLNPNGARIDVTGCDVVQVQDGLLHGNLAHIPQLAIARQIGLVPLVGSQSERGLNAVFNQRTKATRAFAGTDEEPVADGVWVVRGGVPSRWVNAYLIEDEGGVVVFDAGVRTMAPAIAAAAGRHGGLRRVVLGNAHPDHRGGAPALRAEVLCHADERQDAEGDGGQHYFAYSELPFPASKVTPSIMRSFDGGPVQRLGDAGRGRRGRRLPGRPPARPRAGADRAVARVRPPGAFQRLLRDVRRDDARRAPGRRPASGVQLEHRGGAGVDAQARRPRARRGLARPPRAADRRRRERAPGGGGPMNFRRKRGNRGEAVPTGHDGAAPHTDYRDAEAGVLTLRWAAAGAQPHALRPHPRGHVERRPPRPRGRVPVPPPGGAVGDRRGRGARPHGADQRYETATATQRAFVLAALRAHAASTIRSGAERSARPRTFGVAIAPCPRSHERTGPPRREPIYAGCMARPDPTLRRPALRLVPGGAGGPAGAGALDDAGRAVAHRAAAGACSRAAPGRCCAPSSPASRRASSRHARDAHLDGFPAAEHAVAESVDAFVAIQAPFNTRALAGVDPAAACPRGQRHPPAARPAAAEALVPSTLWPTAAQAQEAGMALDDFAAFVERALFLDRPDPAGAWRELSDFQDRLVDRLKAAEELHIEADGTDLRLNVKGRTWVNSDGRRNMPTGEVFTGPVENSANGHIRFTVPSSPGGVDVAGVELTFADGVVARPAPSAARPIWTHRWTPTPGARRLGEIGIGTNFGIDRAVGSILLRREDRRHRAPRARAAPTPRRGGVNESAVHWDLICDLRARRPPEGRRRAIIAGRAFVLGATAARRVPS